MEPFRAIILPLEGPVEPPPIGGGGEPPRPNHDLPLFPFHPIVVPPGGAWPGEPPTGGGEPVYPSLPIYNPGGPAGSYPPGFWGGGMGPGVKPQPPVEGSEPKPEHPIYYPPGTEPPTTEPPPTGEGGQPSHPINLPPSENGYWIMIWVPSEGWVWVALQPITPTPKKK